MIKINQLKVRLERNTDNLTKGISGKLRIKEDRITSYKILKQSLDARKKEDMFFVYQVLVEVTNEANLELDKLTNVEIYVPKPAPVDYASFNYMKDKKIAIIGFGPAGMFSALKFSQSGVNVTVFERGEEVDDRIQSIHDFKTKRVLNVNSNVQFGEGGAGTYSDGKLTNRKKDERGKYLFEELVKAGAPEEITYVSNPHIGTDKLIGVVKHIRQEILSLGSTINFNSQVTNIIKSDDGIVLTVNQKDQTFDYVILATGHSARDTIEMLYENKCEITQKPFAVGFRIEHKQVNINKAQYGPNFRHKKLGAAEYKLTHQARNGKGVYTFCMCPGGVVVPASSEKGLLVVNGMSEYARDKVNANSALLVTVDEKDFKSKHPLAGIKFQRQLEKKAFELGGGNYNAPIQTVGDFLHNAKTKKLGRVLPSYAIGYTFSNLRSVFSKDINDAFIDAFNRLGKKLNGFSDNDALLTGVESRSSSPVRIVRDNITLQSPSIPHFYPTGEGAGYAGGIVSAAVDGIRVAEMILQEIKI